MTATLLDILLIGQAAAEGQPEDPYFFLRFAVTLLPIVVLFYFMIIRPQKKKEQDMQNLIHSIKENDRVVTIGGIYGVVTNVQRDLDRLTIRVDEATGTKLRINMSAVARVLTAEDQEGGTGGSKS